ncbi:MAG: NAD(P)H-dependent oxidoreductase [Cytophagales bacterium]|nr:NAD(P)H-dependent oxidoreductase [Cytophagales bacterium]
MKKVLAFAGSNRKGSINQQLLNYVVSKIENVEVNVINLKDYDVPVYNQDDEEAIGQPENAKKLFELIQEHDGVIIATPEHNGSTTAFLKNVLDWQSRINMKYLEGKNLLVLSASPGGYGGANARKGLEHIANYTGANVSEGYSLGTFFENFAEGKVTNQEQNEKLVSAVKEFSSKF